MATELANKKAEREALRGVIQQWNANRLDLFELSEPNEDLEFHGVMRFYFQDSGQKVATKCIRVASDATTQAVIETLIEKFRPDMRMLSVPEYALYEIHENGEERKLGLEEKPLLVQLNWHIDDREGRFLLRRIDDKTNAQGVGFSSSDGSSFRRKLSKREKKQMKKQEKLSRLKSLEQDENAAPVDQNRVAEMLYTELPETSFTRSISNPEAVMRRRRQQILERKLQQFRSKDGGPDTGGTLKIYGEALCKDVPYKTLLLSVRDSAIQVVREMLSKYGLEKVDPQQYCLVQVNSDSVNGGTQQEYILDDDECPLAILMNHPSARGSIMFHVRRRPADYVPRKRKKKPSGKWNELDHRFEDERLPFLLELNPDGSEIANGAGARHRLQPNVTEVGSERPIGPQAVQAQTLTLTGPTVMPRHCVIAFTENIVTLTPCSRDAHTYVNNQRIHQTTILQNGAIVKFGRLHTFRFIDPAPEERIRQRNDSARQLEYGYDRRSPELSNHETSTEKYGSTTGTAPNNGGQNQIQSQSNQEQTSHPSSPSNSAPVSAAVSHTRSPTHPNHASESTHNYETTFDLDGNVETASLTSSRDGNRTLQNDRQPRGTDPILPAVLEFLEETEETFFHAVITDVEPSAPQFKLAPTYTLYLAARYRASTHYRPELQPTERAHRLTVMLANVASMIQRVIQERYMDASSLALWLANGSELLYMLKNDRHVGAFSTTAQDILTDAVHTAFASLVRCISLELAPAMSQFMADADEPAKEAGVLQIFSNTMALLRRCRVNAALTIQLFSHLFHTINATAFNALVSNANLCVRWFGRRLKARLNALETWAERQGLELASQCHLATIMQATHLLQAPKYNAEELATLSSTCFKLNSLQVRALLQKYQPAADEPRLPAELIENVVRVAESVADALARADGREIRLEEDPTLALALLLPEDGYSCEVIRGVPPGLAEFLAPLQRDGLCRMAPQPTSSGFWTIYMIDHHNNFRSPSAMSNRSGGYSCYTGPSSPQPEIHVIKLHKSTSGMGLSIVAAKGAGQDRLGIYIKSVVAGGAADADGRLTAGDQLLKVDGQSLVGITQEKAAEYLVRTGPVVTLEVAKQGAIYHGLATLLSQPSPVMTRAHKIRPKSEHLESSMVQETSEQPSTSHSLGNLLTVPSRAISTERSIDPIPGEPSCPRRSCSSFVHNVPCSRKQDCLSSSDYPRSLSDRLKNCPSLEIRPPVEVQIPKELLTARHAIESTATTNNEQATVFPLDSIPYIDQVDDTANETEKLNRSKDELMERNRIGEKVELYSSNNNVNDNYIKKDSDRLEMREKSCEQAVEKREQVIVAIDEADEKYEESTHQQDRSKSSSSNDSLDQEKWKKSDGNVGNDQSTVSQMYLTMPELNLDLTGLDSDAWSDVSCSDKCWKSPEEVRLGCGRVAALATHFSKLGEATLLRAESKKFVSEPSFVYAQECKERSKNRFAAISREYLSELDLRKNKVEALPKSPSENEVGVEKAKSDLFSGDCAFSSSSRSNRKREGRGNSREEKLSLSEQWQIVRQLEEMSNLDKTNLHFCSFEKKRNVTVQREETCDDSLSEKHNRLGHFFFGSCPNLERAGSSEDKKERGQRSLRDSKSIAKSTWSYLNDNSDQANKGAACCNDGDGGGGGGDSMGNDDDVFATNVNCNQQKSVDQTIRSTSIDSLRPRRMSERDLPSRLGRDATALQQQMHTSKSVPALHNVDAEAKQQHEVFNPGYSRASSSNSVTPPVTQPPPMSAINSSTSLRSRSSHNLHDPIRVGTLPPTGLVSRQQSSPNLNPANQPIGSSSNSSTIMGTVPNVLQSNEAERFYQNLSIYRNQDTAIKQRCSPSQYSEEKINTTAVPPLQKSSKGSQNSLNRPTAAFEASQTRERPISAYISHNQQQPSYLGSQAQQQVCAPPPRSQSSRDIIRQEAKLQEMQEEVRRRELRGGVPIPPNQYRPTAYNVKSAVTQVASSATRPTKPIGSTSMQNSNPADPTVSSVTSLISPSGHASRQTTVPTYGYLDAQYIPYVGQYGKLPPAYQHQHQLHHAHQHQHQPQVPIHQHQHQHHHPSLQHQSPTHVPYGTSSSRKNDLIRMQSNGISADYARDQNTQEVVAGKSYTDHVRQFPIGSQYYINGSTDVRNDQYTSEHSAINRVQGVPEGSASTPNEIVAPIRPALPEDGYRESPPPPPLNTSTHPLYSKQADSSRYTASMQDPPRGGYYPANGTAGTVQPRQYQYSATNPWQREEREKEQARRREAARQWRDQQIAELSALPHRTSQQEEQLRALKLERDFQKRAEEAANQQDDDEESNDLDTESLQRVQGLIRTTVAQDQSNVTEQQANLSRSNVANQSVRGSHATAQPLGGSIYSPTATTHSAGSQQCTQNSLTICLGQQENSVPRTSPNLAQDPTHQAQTNIGQASMLSTSSLIHSAISQKPTLGISQSTDDREIHRKQEELKRKQAEFEEIARKKEEESKQHVQQIYHHHHHHHQQQQQEQQQQQQQQQHIQQSHSHHKSQQLLHPNMLRMDSLSINTSNVSSIQNGNHEAPIPPERGSSYAVMSQQGALRSNNLNASNMTSLTSQQLTSIKRVSFHDSNANPDSIQRNPTPSTTAMDVITEDTNNFINDAESLSMSQKTPDGTTSIPITGSTPGVIGAQEVYKDPRQRRLAEKQKQQQNSQIGPVPEKLSFKEKMKMFAMETGEDGTPRDKVKISRAQREIDNIGTPIGLNSTSSTSGGSTSSTSNNNNNNNNNNGNVIGNSNNNNNNNRS